jgi:hypothetical protein
MEDLSEQYQRIATVAVESYIRTLEDEGLLRAPADKVLSNYSIVAYKKGFWGSIVEKVFGIHNAPEGSVYFRTVKHIYHSKEQPRPQEPEESPKGRVLSLIDKKKDS